MRPGARNIVASPVNKTTEFKMKNKCESCRRSKSRTFTVVILFFFEGNKMHLALEINSTDLQESGGQSSQLPEANEGSEAEPPTLR